MSKVEIIIKYKYLGKSSSFKNKTFIEKFKRKFKTFHTMNRIFTIIYFKQIDALCEFHSLLRTSFILYLTKKSGTPRLRGFSFFYSTFIY